MLRRTIFAPGAYYHLYNRGTDRRDIFDDDRDRGRFLALLYLCNTTAPVNLRDIFSKGKIYRDLFAEERSSPIVAIGAYCLMPNHYHLLVKEISEGGITTFMKKLGTAYSMYFNTKRQRKGTLFEGRFRAQHAEDDEYLKYLFSYIHLNPVKLVDDSWRENGNTDTRRIKEFLTAYEFSSYKDYLGDARVEKSILTKAEFPEYFEERTDVDNMLDDWLAKDGPL